jgi:hypothetical protein
MNEENYHITRSCVISILRLRFQGLWLTYKDERDNPTREKPFDRCSRPWLQKEMKKINKCIKILKGI